MIMMFTIKNVDHILLGVNLSMTVNIISAISVLSHTYHKFLPHEQCFQSIYLHAPVDTWKRVYHTNLALKPMGLHKPIYNATATCCICPHAQLGLYLHDAFLV